ncbi:5-oxoprolinase subunit PxpB [Vibrio maritimus]|uniref:5-oxoprolinase subunit PxpB n=1 Tax=Vibrio maritimus TaxID=990268 RepID=UPI0040696314
MKTPSVEQVSESALLLTFASRIDTALPTKIASIANQLEQAFSDSITNCTPSYTTLLIEFHPIRCSANEIIQFVEGNSAKDEIDEGTLGKPIMLPTYYGEEVAPDLLALEASLSLSREDIVMHHTSTIYSVCAIGFAPGFAFLAELPEQIRAPRHVTPRSFVPKGSVGIANNQTAVYPNDTPGGWQIIGNCPLTLFEQTSPDQSLLKVGDRVQFHAISKQKFLSLGGRLWDA